MMMRRSQVPFPHPRIGQGISLIDAALRLVRRCKPGGCNIHERPNPNAPVVARVGPDAPLRIQAGRESSGQWFEVATEIRDNFNVRPVNGWVRLVDIEGQPDFPPSTPPTPPPAQQPGGPVATTPTAPGGTTTIAPPKTTLQKVGEFAIVTSPAWGAYLLSRFL
jgi:hypothetical protein